MSPSLIHIIYAGARQAARVDAGRLPGRTAPGARVRVTPRTPLRPRTGR